jgi:ATP-binding cassette subfamily C (CFTR/MRP) protein 10
VLFILLMQTSRNVFDFYLAHWTGSLASVPLRVRLLYMSYVAALNIVIAVVRSFLFAFAGLCAAKTLHTRLLAKISSAGLRFFDSKAIGVIVNRVSSDVDAVDESLPFQLNILLAQACLLLGCVSVICISCPAFTAAVPVLAAVYVHQQAQYRHGSRALKRLESASRSPLFSLLSDVCDGAPTIRAMNSQRFFEDKFTSSLQSYCSVLHALQGASQWFGLRLQLIGASIVALICVFALIERLYPLPFLPLRSPAALAAFIGLSLSQAVPLSSYLNGFVMAFAETEKQFVSVERILQMLHDCAQDADDGGHGCGAVVKVDSRSCAAVRVQNLCVAHRAQHGAAVVLRNVSFSLQRGSYTALVGRSGSGKSTLIHAIARFYASTAGVVALFGQDARTIPASILRGDIVVVLIQEPFIFAASVRFNVDPFNRLPDDQILHELQEIGALSALVDCASRENCHQVCPSAHPLRCRATFGAHDNARQVLDWNPVNLSAHLSFGLQQLVCVARAM